MTNTLITGGAGFIGSHVIKLFVKDKSYNVFNLDSLTYAGSLNNIEGLEKEENYTFIKGDICDKKLLSSLFKKYNFNYVINIAAESHVDRSIGTPTYAPILAEYILNKITSKKEWEKIEHFSQKKTMSWYDLANKITRKVKIEPVNDKEFKQKANRPKNTSLA
jgi:dTDP-D-glucose 4,6-dehydratase